MRSPHAPNFLIVGVTKAGTTFLARKLSEHPDVFFTRPKEPFFFNRAEMAPVDFARYLHDYFGGATQRWVGEGSTNYFHHEHAIDHIERCLGTDVRIIVCLRHPVGRLFSHYLHDYKRGRLTGVEQLGDPAFEGYVARSLYSERLALWKSRFPHFEVLLFDDLVASGSAFYRQATAFLDLDAKEIVDEHVNEGLQMAWDGDAVTLEAPLLSGQIAPRFGRAGMGDLLSRFRPDVLRTMEIVDRDLSPWLALPSFASSGRKPGAPDAGQRAGGPLALAPAKSVL